MIFTTVRVERPEGTALLNGVAVQIEATTDGDERLEIGGARPYDLVWVYTTQGVPAVPLRRRDVLYDEHNDDPETDQPTKYRIVGAVETFADDHQEALCERVIGA